MTGNQEYDEKALLERVAGGDHAAFTRLFDTYHQGLGAFIPENP